MVTFRLRELNAAWKAIHGAEAKLGAGANPEAKRLIVEARQLAGSVPLSDMEASDKAAWMLRSHLENSGED